MDKNNLSKEIGNCHARITNLLEWLGDKNIANVTKCNITEIRNELDLFEKLVNQYNSLN